jgi:hypothetical protein
MKIDKHGFGITDDLTVNEKDNIIYILEFKRFSYTGRVYVSETQKLTQKLTETQHLDETQDLKKLLRDTQWTVEELSFVVGHNRWSSHHTDSTDL